MQFKIKTSYCVLEPTVMNKTVKKKTQIEITDQLAKKIKKYYKKRFIFEKIYLGKVKIRMETNAINGYDYSYRMDRIVINFLDKELDKIIEFLSLKTNFVKSLFKDEMDKLKEDSKDVTKFIKKLIKDHQYDQMDNVIKKIIKKHNKKGRGNVSKPKSTTN